MSEELLRYHELAQLRQAADAAGCAGQTETARLMHGLLDAWENFSCAEDNHATAIEDLENERDVLRDALKEVRSVLNRIGAVAETAGEPNALERHGEIKLLAKEAAKDIVGALSKQ